MVELQFSNSINRTKMFLIKILGLDICADTLVGDEMIKGISGGQKKRLTTGLIHFLLLPLPSIKNEYIGILINIYFYVMQVNY